MKDNYLESSSPLPPTPQWDAECRPFVSYGSYAAGCHHMLMEAGEDAVARGMAEQMERTMCVRTQVLTDYLENTLYIDTLAPRKPVKVLHDSEVCTEQLRDSTLRVLKASDTRQPLSTDRRKTLCRQWEEMVALTMRRSLADYEAELQQRMERYGQSRHEALEYLSYEVQEAIDANHFGSCLNRYGADARALVAHIRGESGQEKGEELSDLIRLAAQKEWIRNEQKSITMEENKTNTTMAPITMNFNAPAQVLPNATHATQTFIYGDEAAKEHLKSHQPPMDEREARMAIYVPDGAERADFIQKLGQSLSTSDVALCVKSLVVQHVVDKAVAYSEGFAQAIMLYYEKVKQPRAIQEVIKKTI